MVIPFLTIYLKSDKNFSLSEVGWVMSSFGVGSVVGAWIGGKLCQTLGFYSLMFWSLFLSGIAFICLQFANDFLSICIGIFFVMIFADSFRPASYVAVDTYSKPENKTRSVSLLRLAINLGFSFGPAVGGFIIVNFSYEGLFWVDGVTCIAAAFLFISLLSRKEARKQKEEAKTTKGLSPWKNYPFLLLLLIVFLVAFTFLQYFSTVPLYYKERYFLDEQEIGWLMFLNGFLIFLIEMPLIKAIEKPSISVYSILLVSLVFLAGSFLVLYFFSWIGILIIGMLFMTFGEIFNFPFINSLAIKSAAGSNLGEYMALFTIAFSVAHIFGHNSGLQLISKFGYETTWLFMAIILILCGFLVLWLKRINLRIENK